MNYRQQARLGIDTCLLVVAGIVVMANCSLIRVAADRFALPAHQPNQHGDSALAADDKNHMSINPASDSGPWWRREGRFTIIEDRNPSSARRDKASSMEDEYGLVARRNTGRSVSRRFRNTCGLAPRHPLTGDRIWNGEAQKYGEWPSYVRIVTIPDNSGSRGSCGGTLISDRHVLTAAHCVLHQKRGVTYRLEPSEMMFKHAVHSIWRPSEYEKSSRAKSICIAKGYVPVGKPKRDDWALIELEEPIAFNDYIQPACLSEEPIQTKGETSECWVVGAGLKRNHPNKVKADYVQKLPVKQVSCDKFKIKFQILDDKHACYADYEEPMGNVCSGDSGGPVLCLNNQNRWTVVAVASGAIKCTEEFNHLNYLGAIYTNMKSLLKDVKAQCGI